MRAAVPRAPAPRSGVGGWQSTEGRDRCSLRSGRRRGSLPQSQLREPSLGGCARPATIESGLPGTSVPGSFSFGTPPSQMAGNASILPRSSAPSIDSSTSDLCFGLTFFSRVIRKWVAPMRILMVPNGCPIVLRRWCIASGVSSSRRCTAFTRCSCSQPLMRRSGPVVHRSLHKRNIARTGVHKTLDGLLGTVVLDNSNIRILDDANT